MNFWIKQRFWFAAIIFSVPSSIAISLLYSEWIYDKDLRYPLALAITGLGFTSAQFYFQINENRYQKISDQKSAAINQLLSVVNKIEDLLNHSLTYFFNSDKLNENYNTHHVELVNVLDLVIKPVISRADICDNLKDISVEIQKIIKESKTDYQGTNEERVDKADSDRASFSDKIHENQHKEYRNKIIPHFESFRNKKREVISSLQN